MAETSINHQQEFMEALGFNFRDLAANREGRITAQQGKEIWAREVFNWSCTYTGFYLVAMALFVAWLLSFWIEYRVGGDKFITGLIVGLPLIAFLLFPIYKNYPLQRDIKERQVWQIQGIAVADLDGFNDLRINNMIFYMQPQVLKHFKVEEPYVIYFLPRSKAVVSIEVMER